METKIPNYHTHTELCRHANGKPIDYALQAKKDGCTELGMSDHCPYPENFGDTWHGIRMSVEEIPLYKQQIQEAREAVDFPVYMGFECEWNKCFKNWYQDELKGTYGADYLVLGPHWVSSGDNTYHMYIPDVTDHALISRYVDQTIQGMESGIFKFLAHPDLFMKGYKEWDAESKAWSKALIDAAADLNMPIEINGLGMSREPNETSKGIRFQYPYLEFWQMASETDVKIICNSDAHDPEDVIKNARKARNFAKDLNLYPLNSLDLQKN